jgi:hypothetical protein
VAVTSRPMTCHEKKGDMCHLEWGKWHAENARNECHVSVTDGFHVSPWMNATCQHR